MSQTLAPYLALSSALFMIGLFGLLSRRNLVAVLISLELVLNSASINFVAFGRFCMPDKAAGQTFAIFIIALAAAEVCIGLSLILALFRRRHSIELDKAEALKG